jgi:UDP-glucose 4-epimerase
VKFLVTGATGFLGWRSTVLLRESGHDVIALARPGGAPRAHARDLDVVRLDAGARDVGELVAGCDAILHFAGVPDPKSARIDPARAVRENVGTTLNLLAAAAGRDAGLVYPSTLRAAMEPPPDEYALSKRLGEEVCRLHRAAATVLRLSSVFGPGQLAREGATGAIANFAARALAGEPIVIPGNPKRTRDFLYVDDIVPALESIAADGRWNATLTFGSGERISLLDAAEAIKRAAGSSSPIQTPGGTLAPGEDESYEAQSGRDHGFHIRPFEEAIQLYVDWLRSDPAAQGRAGA